MRYNLGVESQSKIKNMHGGKFVFKDLASGNITTSYVEDTTPSKLAAAATAAVTALSANAGDVVVGDIHAEESGSGLGGTLRKINGSAEAMN